MELWQDLGLDNSNTESAASSEAQGPQDRSAFSWTRANTLILLELYKKYRSHVGTMQIRNFKKLWAIISQIFKGKYGIDVSPSNCENRWRVLERNFKKWIDNKKQTGAGRKFFEYAEEMNEILGKKKNINPTVLLSTTTISEPPDINQETTKTGAQDANTNKSSQENVNPATPPTESRKRKLQFLRTRNTKPKNNDSLERLRKDKEERHKERMGYEKDKFERLYALEVKKQESREKRNALSKENNDLQRERNTLLAQALRIKTSNFDIFD